MVDVVVLGIIAFFALVGLRKGFWQYLLELLITAAGLSMAWLYYQQKHQIFTALFVFIWAVLGLSALKWFLQRARRKKALPNLKPLRAHRLLGAILGSIWGIFIAALLILTLGLLPLKAAFSGNIKEKIQNSHAYAIFQRVIPIKEISIVENISYISKIAEDKNAQLRLFEQTEFQEAFRHESFKAVMEDPQTLKQLKDKDLRNLLANPKILKLLNDGEFIEKLVGLDFKKALEK